MTVTFSGPLKEKFWSQFAKGGPREGKSPTYGEYGKALEQSLRDAGCGDAAVNLLSQMARLQRELYGLKDTDLLKVVPTK